MQSVLPFKTFLEFTDLPHRTCYLENCYEKIPRKKERWKLLTFLLRQSTVQRNLVSSRLGFKSKLWNEIFEFCWALSSFLSFFYRREVLLLHCTGSCMMLHKISKVDKDIQWCKLRLRLSKKITVELPTFSSNSNAFVSAMVKLAILLAIAIFSTPNLIRRTFARLACSIQKSKIRTQS